MRDQAYFKRLNQIREKYGYLNQHNPEQQPSRKPQPPSHNTHPFTHNYMSSYETPLKSKQNQLNSQLSYETNTLKKEYSRPSTGFSSHRMAERSYRQIQHNQQNTPKYVEQSYKRSPNVRYPIPQNTPPPLKIVNNDNESPIKMLNDLSANRNLPKDLPHTNEQSMPLTHKTIRKNSRTLSNFTERTFIGNTNPLEQNQSSNAIKANNRSLLPQRRFTPTPFEQTPQPTPSKQLQLQGQSSQFESNYSASLNNIDKLQQKIQLMLKGKGKK